MPTVFPEALDVNKNIDCTLDTAGLKINQNKVFLFIKRAFDLISSIIALVILFFPLLFVGLLIWLESPGPVLYKQERLGKNGKPFLMYKFRSMHLNAEESGPQWAQIEDPRCTKIGRVIRLWHIDELPQLINVIKGEMSVVGPRPERAYFYDEFEKDIPGFRMRLLVDQGLTCVAQVNGGYDITPQDKLIYDLEYIRNQSLWLDLKCMLKTIFVVIRHKGAR